MLKKANIIFCLILPAFIRENFLKNTLMFNPRNGLQTDNSITKDIEKSVSGEE
ncbi:hypothetical protein CLV59_103469 [Chitinophaga dinghuensis]|uniref:Uncharacterized protein n=1 Tax=Chitinophaga dinghuensis TaxID=1539050 RepID=A0A327W2J6_9BACT|nr:hypothetical protein CLV59_103469 [Chitinophaga dinghuensis]